MFGHSVAQRSKTAKDSLFRSFAGGSTFGPSALLGTRRIV